MLRSFGAIIAGLVAASIVAMVVQTMGHMMFPPPKEVQTALQSKDAKVRGKAILESAVLILDRLQAGRCEAVRGGLGEARPFFTGDTAYR